MEKLSKEECYKFLEFIENEKEDFKLDEIQCKLLWNLEGKNEDMNKVKEDYKELLLATNRNDNNYYAKVCLLINSMNSFKESKLDLKINLNTFSNYYTEIIIKENEKNSCIIPIKINYNACYWVEGIGKENNLKELENIKEETKNLLEEENIDLGKIKVYLLKLERYMVKTYGRWSIEFEKYQKVVFKLWGCFYPSLRGNLMKNQYKFELNKMLNEVL